MELVLQLTVALLLHPELVLGRAQLRGVSPDELGKVVLRRLILVDGPVLEPLLLPQDLVLLLEILELEPRLHGAPYSVSVAYMYAVVSSL